MFAFLGPFFFWLGVGMMLALAWILVRYVVPLLVVMALDLVRTIRLHARAFAEGFRAGASRRR